MAGYLSSVLEEIPRSGSLTHISQDETGSMNMLWWYLYDEVDLRYRNYWPAVK